MNGFPCTRAVADSRIVSYGRINLLVLVIEEEYLATFHGSGREQVVHGYHVFTVTSGFGGKAERGDDQVSSGETIRHVVIRVGTGIVSFFP